MNVVERNDTVAGTKVGTWKLKKEEERKEGQDKGRE